MRDLLKELNDRNRESSSECINLGSRTLILQEAPAIGWISFDDIEFNLPEALNADELAQCLVELTRCNIDTHPGHGETEHYHLYYDERRPGQVVLEEK